MMQSMFKSRGSGKPLVIEGLTIEIVTKIRTNYKLNLKEVDKQLIPKTKEIDDEIHYVKFEGFYPTFELSQESLKNGPLNLEFRDWTIVDFDDFLKGNNHLS